MKVGPLAAVLSVACGSGPGAELVDGFPADQQETMARAAVDKDWPLTVGRGTLACRAGAVVFRANGVTYAVNDTAKAQGFQAIDGVRSPRPSRPPADPFKRMTQQERMQVFADLAKCSPVNDCTSLVSARYRLTAAELRQIRDEGNERSWPPLERGLADLQPLVDRGLKLCKT